MNFHLVVLKPFATYRRGELITDAQSVRKILASANAACVVRVMAKGN